MLGAIFSQAGQKNPRMQDNFSSQLQIHKRLAPKIWLPIVILAAFAVGYFALANVNNWWPFGEQNQEVIITNQESPSIMLDGRQASSGDDEFDGWQTYRNEEYGFEVKYPGEWTGRFGENLSLFRMQNYKTGDEKEGLNPSQVFLEVFVISLTNNSDYATRVSNALSVNISGQIAIKGNRAIADISPYPGYDMYIPSGNNLIVLAGSYDGLDSKSLNYIQQVYSTFKFIDVDEISDWQTYRNEKYRFEVKYPNEWEIEEGNTIRLLDLSVSSLALRLEFESFKVSPDPLLHSRVKNLENISRFYLGTDYDKVFEYFADGVIVNSKDSFGRHFITYDILTKQAINITALSPDSFLKNDIRQILSSFKFIELTEQNDDKEGACVQVITPARNRQTGEVRDFPTPCDVPEGWEIIG